MLTELNIFKDHPEVIRVFKGGYVCRLNTADMSLSSAVGNGGNYDYDKSYFELGPIFSYGVIDNPDQFLEKFGTILEGDKREISVFFTWMPKDPNNKGKSGGWRWHKWGEYHGNGTPTREYLDDEDEFNDGVYVYHMYIVDGVNEKCVGYYDIAYDGFTFRKFVHSVEEAKIELLDRKEKADDITFGELVLFEQNKACLVQSSEDAIIAKSFVDSFGETK
jgi:hypothetical protein